MSTSRTVSSHISADSLRQAWPKPAVCRPIVIIGAGGIVNDAHLPAYRKAGFPVAGIYDLDRGRAARLAATWSLPVFDSLAQAVAVPGAVFDLAIPPAAHLDVLRALPEGAGVLLQKPMGRDLAEATAILRLVQDRKLVAAVNFQLRFAPMMLAVADAAARGFFGRIIDIDVHITVLTPWHLFPFLNGMPRVEIAVHSIHYLDLIRGFLGNPRSVMARTLGHPQTKLAQTRTSAILDFDADVRCLLSINHHHDFGPRFQDATIKLEGEEGAAVITLGALLNYPTGMPDAVWITRQGSDWCQVPLIGTWFPDAFIGTMSNLQRVAAGEDDTLLTSVQDAWHSMALVEACFRSSAGAATPVPVDVDISHHTGA
ncbi:Gfo/Idh/MocA family oxidoreductase [Acidisoma cellulosilytica]|uniref:Gfo/Idh/MocA family oxidoreductase n=1 Tax=Acidisoma cellulosilyticum TaxID=2802395 RepID=A0A963Z1T2_9PROT|nr:Gfo/Idh/MocA family oxidoreductase [Acidisoma cellulosilyticum]MCB8881134.1 Gfo/Idh/MocA family oxidoreductase [Acidisoma cellulosilyticum]